MNITASAVADVSNKPIAEEESKASGDKEDQSKQDKADVSQISNQIVVHHQLWKDKRNVGMFE